MNKPDDTLDTIQGEINGLIQKYDTRVDSYITNIEKDNKAQAKRDIAIIRNINSKLLSLMSRAKESMDAYINQYGRKSPQMILFDVELQEVTRKLNVGESKIKLLHQEINDISGINKVVTRKIGRNRIKYFLIILLVVIVFGLTIRAFIVSDSNAIDNIILVSFVVLLIFHLFA